MPYQLGQFWIRPSELVLLYRFLSVFEAVVCASSIPLRISPRDAGKSNALGTTPMRLNQLQAVTRLAALSAALRPCTPSATVTCYWRGLQRKLGNDSRARMLNVSNSYLHNFGDRRPVGKICEGASSKKQICSGCDSY